MSIKGLPGRGIYGWDSASETWVKILIDSNGKIQITSTDLTSILADTDELQGDWADGGRLDALIDAIKAKTDNLPIDPADASNIAADFDRHLSKWDIWSENVSVVQIPTTADQDINLPDVVVSALPAGATIWKVYLLFKCSIIRDTSGSDNGIDEVGLIRIKKDGDATFDGNGLTAYNILDNAWTIDVTNVGRDRGGDAFVGKIDLSSKVDGADTYELRLDSVSADGTNLELHDVAVGLRVIFY